VEVVVLRIGRRRGVRVYHFFGKLPGKLGSNGVLDVVGDRALLAAVACFAAASPTTSAANVFVAELTEGVNGYWIDTTVLNWKSFGATVVGIMSCSVAHGTYAVGLSEGNVMSRGVLLDIGKKFCDGYVGRVVDLREVEDNCARIRNVIDAAKDAVHLR
jgi:hypothetical protein